jgi:hypothetical protein
MHGLLRNKSPVVSSGGGVVGGVGEGVGVEGVEGEGEAVGGKGMMWLVFSAARHNFRIGMEAGAGAGAGAGEVEVERVGGEEVMVFVTAARRWLAMPEAKQEVLWVASASNALIAASWCIIVSATVSLSCLRMWTKGNPRGHQLQGERPDVCSSLLHLMMCCRQSDTGSRRVGVAVANSASVLAGTRCTWAVMGLTK